MRNRAMRWCAIMLAAAAPADGASNAVLTVGEFDGARFERPVTRAWATVAAVPSPGVTGVVQEITWQGVAIRVQYGAFESAAAAHAAALAHVAGTAAGFQQGLWSHARLPAIGDESWWTRGSGAHALLIRSENVCALIGCRGGDAETRDRVAETFAARIAAKARTARRVALPPDTVP